MIQWNLEKKKRKSKKWKKKKRGEEKWPSLIDASGNISSPWRRTARSTWSGIIRRVALTVTFDARLWLNTGRVDPAPFSTLRICVWSWLHCDAVWSADRTTMKCDLIVDGPAAAIFSFTPASGCLYGTFNSLHLLLLGPSGAGVGFLVFISTSRFVLIGNETRRWTSRSQVALNGPLSRPCFP